MLSKDLQGLYEAYKGVYEEIDSITDDLVEEVIEELFEEYVAEGYTVDEAAIAIEEAATEYLMELNPYAPAGSKEARSYAQSTSATKRGVERKAAVKGAVERVKAKAKGIKAAAGIAGSIAKDEARRAGRAAVQSVKSGVEKKKEQVKSGIKGFLGKAAKKVASKASSVAAKLGEETQQIDEVSDRLARAARNTRDRRYNASFGDGGMSANYMKQNAKKDMLNKTLASRAARTGSKIKPVEEEVEAIQEADSVAAMRERAAKRRQQRYGNQGGGGRDDFRPYTEDDYKNPKPGYGSSTKKEEFDVFDVVLEFLQAEGIAKDLQEAEWMMANLLDKEEIGIIVEAMHEEEDEEDEKEMKKGKKSKKEKEDEDEEEEELDEATYSAKAARAGKDIGNPGKAFAKIAKSAAKRYGSKERGEKVAGAVLAKLRASKG